MKIYEQIEKAMSIVCIVEPVTSYRVQVMRNNNGDMGATIDIQRQQKADVQYFLEPQGEAPHRNHLVFGILVACGWREIGSWKPHEFTD